MKILRYEPNEYSQKLFTLQLEFNNETGILSGSVGTKSYLGDLIRDFSIDLNLWCGKLIDVILTTTDNGHEIVVYDRLKNYAIGNGMPDQPEKGGMTSRKLFSIAVHETIDNSIIQIRQGHEEIEGFENIVEDGDITLHLFNLKNRELFADKLTQLARWKADKLGSIDQRDSVSYLEAQVDILTRLVLRLHPDSTDELVALLQKADEHSVLNIKNMDSIAEEFDEKKALVRTAQKDYYDAKAKEVTA